MTSPIPIDLTQIAWTNSTISRFEVSGTQGARQLLRDDGTAAIIGSHLAEVAHDTATGEVTIFLNLALGISSGTPAQPTDISGRFELDFSFSVGNLAEFLLAPSHSDPQLHPQLLLMLTSVAYSTARGILWTRLAGTALEGITLPLINPSQLFQPVAPPVPARPSRKPRSAAPARPKKPKA